MRNDGKLNHYSLATLAAATGLAFGVWAGQGIAQRTVPVEHKGISVDALGVVPAVSMQAQLGLAGYQLQLREITIEPGGQIARHSHAGRPGIVKLVSGSWLEGRPQSETLYDADQNTVIIEDATTEHWFWNDGDEAATAYVCDIVAAS